DVKIIDQTLDLFLVARELDAKCGRELPPHLAKHVLRKRNDGNGMSVGCRQVVVAGRHETGANRNRAGLYGTAAGMRPPRLCYAGYLHFLEFGIQSWRNCLSLYAFLALPQHF